MSLERDPGVEGAPVTASNWRDPPFNRWAFWHVGEILPTYRVPRGDEPARPLPAAAAPDLLAVAVTRIDGSAGTAGEILEGTFTDAYVVLQDGQVVAEWYGPLGALDRAHALMSVSKSVVGCVAAVLIDRGQLDAEREVTSYVPELAASGYAGATVRHVLDMRSGVRFVEEYANPHADIRRLDEWIGWRAGRDGGEPRGLYPFLTALTAEAPHGDRFLYRSAESDVLGWVCERAAGQPMSELISALVWAPMGAEHDASLLHDGLGTAVHDGGLCATARDVARFGQMLLDGGIVPDGAGGTRRVIPPRWLRQGWAVDSDVRAAFAASPAESAFPGGWYRNQFWFRPGAHGDVLLCLGIHGQMLHVSRRTGTVCLKFSSWPQAQNPAYLEDTLRAFDAIGGMLAGRDPITPAQRRRGLAGVVSGLSRRGDTVPPAPPLQPNVI
jgi:CubicO group peptidase (beta-lactamase class C family)